jgi:hypothetical protein
MIKIKNQIIGTVVLGILALACMSMQKIENPVKLSKVKVDKSITIAVPHDWRPMDGLDFSQRYPSVRAPLAAYTDQDRLVDFSVNISATQWPDQNLKLAQSFFKSSVLNMFDDVTFLQEGIHTIDGKEFIFLEFESRIEGTRDDGLRSAITRYTYIQYLIEPGRTLAFSFNCPLRIKSKWQDTAHAMMDRIRVK